jgi:hypothetical protein
MRVTLGRQTQGHGVTGNVCDTDTAPGIGRGDDRCGGGHGRAEGRTGGCQYEYELPRAGNESR